MAGDAGDGGRSLAGGLANKAQEDLGVLAISFKQRDVDYLGSQSQRVRADRFAGLSGFPEHQGNCEE